MMSAAAIRGQPLRAGQQRRAAAGRRTAVQTQALFGFLAPPKAKASPSRANVREPPGSFGFLRVARQPAPRLRPPQACRPRVAAALHARPPSGLPAPCTPTRTRTAHSRSHVAGTAQELVSELLELSERTQGGLNASGARREQIAELVEELEGFCPRSPLRNPLLYGDYEVRAGGGWANASCSAMQEGTRSHRSHLLAAACHWHASHLAPPVHHSPPAHLPAAPQVVYTSKPTAAGGPYRTLPGRIVFPGQRPLQSIVEPNVLVGVAGGGWCAWVVGGSGWNLQAGAVVQAAGCGWLGLAMGIRGR